MEHKKRNGFIDLWRFIAMMMIMAHHQYRLGIDGFGSYYGWVFVEFYFMLTGYLTTSHFDRINSGDLEERCHRSIHYTLKKFTAYLPFAWVAIILEYFFRLFVMYPDASVSEIVSFLSDLPFELLLIGSSYTKPALVPLWYLSAMFIVFPVFCLLLQTTSKNLRAILSFIIPVLYYGAFGVADNWTFPLDLARAFSAMLLGVSIYEMGRSLLPKLYARINSYLLTAIQLLCLVLPVIACHFAGPLLLRPIILCFFVGISITFSGKSLLSGINNRLMVYLGKISMPIYLFHWTVAGIISIVPNLGRAHRILLYYVGSILVGVAAFEIHRFTKKIAKAK